MDNTAARRALLVTRYRHADVYAGTAEKLCACGLAELHQFPGEPGRGKSRASYFLSDGQPMTHGSSTYERTLQINRTGSSRFSVAVEVSDEEAERRKAFLDHKHNLPLDIPESPCRAAPTAPGWAPAGFTFLRCHTAGYVFNASAEALRVSGVMDEQAVPSPDSKRQTHRFRSKRFGLTVIVRRTSDSFIVVLSQPSEIGNEKYASRDFGSCVYHRGTKRQLQDRGFGIGFGFPGEPHCNQRKVTAGSAQIHLLRPSDWWGDVPRYEILYRRSESEQAAATALTIEEEAKKQRIHRLKSMPERSDQFKDGVADTFWKAVCATKAAMESKDGYRFCADVVEEFMDSAEDAYWTLKNGGTEGISPRKKLQQVMGKSAKADMPLQRFLANFSGTASD